MYNDKTENVPREEKTEELAGKKRWEKPELFTIDIEETEADLGGSSMDGSGFS